MAEERAKDPHGGSPKRAVDYGGCENCVFYLSDEEGEGCTLDLDEDEYLLYAVGARQGSGCPYFRDGDEYRTVRKQI